MSAHGDPAGANVIAPAGPPTTGAHLRNVIREPLLTCRVCTAPVDGFYFCWRCRQHRQIAGAADVVAPLCYAVAGTPSADLVCDYKNHPARTVRDRHAGLIAELVRDGVDRHQRCLERHVGLPVSCRLAIPSLTGRPGRHPFTEALQAFNLLSDEVALTPAADATCTRAVHDKFVVPQTVSLRGQHVLILDDVWTTGSNAQSAAVAVHRAGAAAVSVMVVGRWLNPAHQLTADFIATRLDRAYDRDRCPVTGGRCR